MDIIIAAEHFFLNHVHANIFKDEFFNAGRLGCATQLRFDASHKFRNGKGFGNVIVGTGGQTFDFVFFFAFGREHDDGNVFDVRFGADEFANVHSGHFGQHPIQQNYRRAMFLYLCDCFVAAAFHHDVVAFFFKIVFEHQSQRFFVFNDHDQMFHRQSSRLFSFDTA